MAKSGERGNQPLPGEGTSGDLPSHAPVTRPGLGRPTKSERSTSAENQADSKDANKQGQGQRPRLATVKLGGSSEKSASGPLGFRQNGAAQTTVRVETNARHTLVAYDERISVEDHENDDSISVVARSWSENRSSISSAAFSMLLHSLLLTLLAFVFMRWQEPPVETSFRADFSSVPEPEWTEDDSQTQTIEITVPEENTQSLLDDTATDQSLATDVTTPSIFENNDDSSAEEKRDVQNDAPVAKVDSQPAGGGLQGRSKSARSKLASQRGGSAESEQAVERGLKWIINHQRPDGSWRLDFRDSPCRGRCRNHGTRESTTAATGLALMALLGAGYTHQDGKYAEQVQDGINYLLSRMRKTYFGGNLAEGSMYAQGIATIALSEAYTMTRDPKLKEPVQLAQHYIVVAQHSRGGWRYNPGEPGDMTVTGWQLMALKSCELSDITAPKKTWDKAREFMGTLGESGGCYYGYLGPGKEPSPTAIGLLMNMYMGWSHDRNELAVGTDYLVDLGPSRKDIYFNYYATLVMHHYGGKHWETWNGTMRDLLIKTQESKGHAEGSWFFREEHAMVGGRLYTTAMAIMILEVYYRYLPIYENGTRQ